MAADPAPEPPPQDPELAALARATRDVYARQAERFAAARSRALVERAWLDRFRALVPPGGRILDVGCGTGEPIAAYLAQAGHPLTGVDFAAPMLALARRRFPDGDWRCADMRTLALPERFAGIVGWDSFFHLTADEQRATLPRLAAHLAPGGALLLTVGPRAGEVVGHVGSERVYHASLSPVEYGEILARLGLAIVRFVPEDPACGGHSVLLAAQIR